MADPKEEELDAQTKLILGLSILAFALTAQAFLIYSNVGYVWTQFGWAVLIAYATAAWALIALPFIKVHMPPELHIKLRVAQYFAVAFSTWITLEENVHASEGWKAPTGATHLAEAVFEPDAASKIVMVVFIAVIFGVIEIFSHFTHIGAQFAWFGWCGRRKLVKKTRRKV
jgi:hypothetical protein